ncbi:unnamed protein product [Amoebophrya sp. A25]|nr:unnamed protein product [Amoebophrya sp. A25]|eukprot:GSA25T00005643001.1
MRAAIWASSSSASVVSLPKPPPPGPNEILVRVRAVALNPVDYKVRLWPLRHIYTPTLGRDFSGEVIEVGSDVPAGRGPSSNTDGASSPGAGEQGMNLNAFQRGDAVMGITGGGGNACAEYVVVSASRAVRKPPNLSFEAAAGVGVVYLTGYCGLFAKTAKKDRKAICAGQSILIAGGSGGTGTAAVQLAKSAGCEVYAICSSKNEQFVKGLGTDGVFLYDAVENNESLVRKIRQAVPNGFDLIYDTVSSGDGPDMNYEAILRPLLKDAGASSADTSPSSSPPYYVALNTPKPTDWIRTILSAAVGRDLTRGGYDLFLPDPSAANWRFLAKWFEDNKVNVQVDKTFDFTDEGVTAAFVRMRSRRAVGKVVIKIA